MKRRLVLLFMAGALALSACSTGDEDATGFPSSNVGTSGLILTAEIDPESSSVILPGDRFGLTEWETQQLLTTQSTTMAVCARQELGISWEADPNWDTPQPSTLMFSALGPWTRDMADHYGFAKPAPTGVLVANGILPKPEDYEKYSDDYPNSTLSEAQLLDGVETCGGNAESKQFDVDALGIYDGPWTAELNEARVQTMEDERVLAVAQELKTCGREQGITITDVEGGSGVFPVRVEGADPWTIDEEQIALANKYVTCMEQTDAVKRVTDVWAEKQAPIIEEYADELVAQRQRIDDALAKANAYLAEHQDVIYKPKYVLP